jgi:hypothetical protein
MKQIKDISLLVLACTSLSMSAEQKVQLIPATSYAKTEFYETFNKIRFLAHSDDVGAGIIHSALIPLVGCMGMGFVLQYIAKDTLLPTCEETAPTLKDWWNGEAHNHNRWAREYRWTDKATCLQAFTFAACMMAHIATYIVSYKKQQEEYKKMKKELHRLKGILATLKKEELEQIFNTTLIHPTFSVLYVGYEQQKNAIVVTTKEYDEPFLIPLYYGSSIK